MKTIKRIFVLGLGLAVLGGAAGVMMIISISSDLPQIVTVEDYKPLLVSEVYDRDEKKIGEFFREKRILTPFNEIPAKLVNAFVAAEDSSFYSHHGINFVAIGRAVMANIKAGYRKEGASTITQQVARTLLLQSREKTYLRKIREAILAYRMEEHLSKEDILYLYLNQIYLGQGAYGVTAAAEIYYRKNLKDITLEEAAMLAGLPKAPSRFDPTRNPKRAKQRQRYVLTRMENVGFISAEQAKEAKEKELVVYKRQNYKQFAPYYLETVRQLLVEKLGEKVVLDHGIKVYTGLDLENQKAAQEHLRAGLRELDKRQGFRGPIQNIDVEDPEVLGAFLLKTRDKLIDKAGDAETILPDGTNPPLPELAIAETPTAYMEDLSVQEAKANIPDYIQPGDIVRAVVIGIDDNWGLVRLRFAESIGMIDIETMKWARQPNPEVRFDWDQIKKPSQALKVGDVVEVKVAGSRFYSPRIEREVRNRKGRDKRFERPDEIKNFNHWARLKLEQEPIAESSLISFDQETQEIIAMVGGYDFKRSEFNRTLQSARQTGSAFKAIVYAAAMDRNYTPATLITDAPIVYEEEIQPDLENDLMSTQKEEEKVVRKWKPLNHSKRFDGEILFRNALIRSLNVPTVKILQKIGVPIVADYARRLGIFSPMNMDYTLGLGSSGITLYEVTKVFSQFGRLGQRIRPLLIHRVETRDGEVLLENIALDQRFEKEMDQFEKEFEERRLAFLKLKEIANEENAVHNEEAEFAGANKTEEEKKRQEEESKKFSGIPPLFFDNPNQLMKPQTAYLITSLLAGAVHEKRGTGGAARALGRRVAGKTGSSSNYYDGWFMGYTPQVSTGVWVGFDQERSLGRSEVGGRNALPIWLNYMKFAHQDLPKKEFPVPSDIIFANIDNETGKLASANTKNYVRQAFIDGTEPKEMSDSSQIEDETDFFKEDLE